ncbi:MAG: tetratricopeptide repeat protein [SAR324 cluster bacterium]|nr:tetratricopeptide repeat protein [SAR324 cluster bacterium]
MDDQKYFLDDPLMISSDGLVRIWLNPLDNNGVWPYLPMTRSTFWLESQLWGRTPSASHWINIIFHTINALLLWLMLRQFSVPGAWIISMLFALHPIHVQSVAWIAERKNVVAGIFYVLTIWSYLLWLIRKYQHWYFLALVCFLCALLSKTSTIMLPVIFVFCHLWCNRPIRKKQVLQLLPFFLVALGIGFVRVWFELHSFGASAMGNDLGMLERFLNAGHVPFFYLRKILLPYPLIFVYPRWHIDPAQISMYFPIASLFLIMGILFWKYKIWAKGLFWGLGAYLVMLFPVLGFFNNSWFRFSFVTDHWVHLPSISILFLIVAGILSFSHYFRLPWFTKAGGFLLFIVLGTLTLNQSKIYQNGKSLWLATIRNNPNAWIAHQELGREYLDTKEYELALDHSNKALAMHGNLAHALNNRGGAYYHLGQYENAVADYDEALAIRPIFPEVYKNRGLTYFALKRYKEALSDYDNAIRWKPNWADTYHYRGMVLLSLNQPEKSIHDYQKSLELQPNQAEVYHNQGVAFFQLKQYKEAISSYSTALQLDQNDAKTYHQRGLAYSYMRQFEQGIQDFTKAIELQPNEAKYYYFRGLNYAALHNHEQALKDYTKIIEVMPDATDAYINRGLLYMVTFDKRELACRDWKMACRLGDCVNYYLARKKEDCLD